jgi:hypothetical protein
VEQIHKSPKIAVFFGGKDTLPDMQALIHGLNRADIDVNAEVKHIVKEYDNQGQQHAKATGKVIFDGHSDGEKHHGSPLIYLKCIPEYEHLCLLWADSLAREVLPDVIQLLERHHAEQSQK